MEIIISNSTSKPIYEQITSVITVQKAYEDLQKDGFIETTVGRGSFVRADNKEYIQEEKQREIESCLQKA